MLMGIHHLHGDFDTLVYQQDISCVGSVLVMSRKSMALWNLGGGWEGVFLLCSLFQNCDLL